MARFWIGTSGWNYKHWIGLFYPAGLPAARWFEFYSQHFSTVEINNTFYREAAPRTYDSWRERAPVGFRFAVKAHRFLTHRKRLRDPADPLSRIVTGARRLEGCLGPILYQLPPRFRRTDEHAARLEAFLELLPRDLMHAVEFRDATWWVDDTLAQLRRHNVAFCTHDMEGAEAPLAVTAGFAYVRFHGRDKKYSGNYPVTVLKQWARRLSALPSDVDEIFCYFNNDIGGHAIKNAKTLATLLRVPASAAA